MSSAHSADMRNSIVCLHAASTSTEGVVCDGLHVTAHVHETVTDNHVSFHYSVKEHG